MTWVSTQGWIAVRRGVKGRQRNKANGQSSDSICVFVGEIERKEGNPKVNTKVDLQRK